jgi:hypothetical protein
MSTSDRPFVIIGENIHCTRKVKRGGKRTKPGPDGHDWVLFGDEAGGEKLLPVPESIRQGEAYQRGSIPHVAAAVALGMSGSDKEKSLGVEYLDWLARRQEARGARYLDVNVDESSPRVEERNAAMRWAVDVLAKATKAALSIDSSEMATLEVGVETAAAQGGAPPMLNSASLERPEAVDLAARFHCPTILMASSASGLPSGVDDRLENLRQMIDRARSAGLALRDLYADPLIYTVSATPDVAVVALEVIRKLRDDYPEIHIAGGHSNISFGLPQRRLLNAVWLQMAMEAGVDSGLIDPVTCHPDDVAKLDPNNKAVQMARNGFLGEDPYFAEFIMAHREGQLPSPF